VEPWPKWLFIFIMDARRSSPGVVCTPILGLRFCFRCCREGRVCILQAMLEVCDRTLNATASSSRWISERVARCSESSFDGALDLSQSPLTELELTGVLQELVQLGVAHRVRFLNLFMTNVRKIPDVLRRSLPHLERLWLGCAPLVAVPTGGASGGARRT
jgi:hypothetical protein